MPPVIRRHLIKRLQEVNLSLEDSQTLLECLEQGAVSADDRYVLAKVVRATHTAQELLNESIPSARTPPQPQAKRKRQLAKASRRRNRR